MNEVNFKVGDIVILDKPFQESTFEFVILSIKDEEAVLLPRFASQLKVLPVLPPVPLQFLSIKTDAEENLPVSFSGFRQVTRR